MNRRNPERTRKLLFITVPAAFVVLVLVFLALANVPAKRPGPGDSAQPASSQRVEQPAKPVDGDPSDYHEQEQDAARKDDESRVVNTTADEAMQNEDVVLQGEAYVEEEASSVVQEDDAEVFVMPEGAEYKPQEVLLRVDPNADPQEVEELLAATPGIAARSVTAEEVSSGLVCAATENDTNVEDAINALNAAPSTVVLGSQPNYVYHLAEESLPESYENETLPEPEEESNDDLVSDGAEAQIELQEEPFVMEEEAQDEGEGTTELEFTEDATDDKSTDEGEQGAESSVDVEAVTTNDAQLASLWGLASLRANDAWELAKCSDATNPIAVAVLDNGFNVNHEDLADNIIPGSPYNAVTDGTDVSPTLGNHGTMVAGVVGAVANNGLGVAGISYNARIVPVKLFDDDGKAYTSTLTNAYNYILAIQDEYNIRVVNLSVGKAVASADFEDDALINKVRQAYSKGIVTVAAACNSNSNNGTVPFYAYPADSESVVSVMNLTGSKSTSGNDASGAYSVSRASSSNYNCAGQGSATNNGGKNICAPGQSIYSTAANGGYTSSSGTSFASPYVAGILALEFASSYSWLSASQAVNALYSTAHDLGSAGWDETYGHGEADAYAAVCMARELSRPTASIESTFISAESVTYMLTSDMVSLASTSMTYDGRALRPKVTVTYGGRTLNATTDYDVAYVKNTYPGTARVLVTGKGSYVGSVVKTFQIAKRSISNSVITSTLSPAQFSYDGSACEPTVTLVHDKRVNGSSVGTYTLVEDTDYTVSYQNHVNAGTAMATIVGKGNYTGTKTINFTIASAVLQDHDVVLDQDAGAYMGEAICPHATVTHGGRTLIEGTDYTMTYGVSVTYGSNASAGMVTVCVTGRGNYSGTVNKQYRICERLSEDVQVAVLGDHTYTGAPITPQVVVTKGTVTLKEDSDYTLEWENNVNAGTARVQVVGIGTYGGVVDASFDITPASVRVPSARQGLVYTGTAQQGVAAGTGYVLSGTAKATKAGTYEAIATLTDTRNYQWDSGGTEAQSITWSIAPADLSGASIGGIAKQAYTGKAVRPAPQVVLGAKMLALGTDYKLTYQNNQNVGMATVVVTGTGNYRGSKSVQFAIVSPTVAYRARMQGGTWQAWKKNGKASGAAGKKKRLEMLCVKLANLPVTGGVTYRTYVGGKGWQAWKKNGAKVGTAGKRLEGVQIKLTGNMKKKYSVRYRVYMQGSGWTPWKKNGATAGKLGEGKRIEAIQVKLALR